VLPERWQGFSASRKFRGVTYNIAVSRKGVGNKVSLKVDGKAIDGAVVLPPKDGKKEVKVEATLG